MNELDHKLLRRAIELSALAPGGGDTPFGAVLADPEGTVLAEAVNKVLTTGDTTAHAETALIRLATSTIPHEQLATATLYASTEPCVMCAGAVLFSPIPRLVYGLANQRLREIRGHLDFNPTVDLDCRSVIAAGHRPVEVVGPELADEAAIPHESYW